VDQEENLFNLLNLWTDRISWNRNRVWSDDARPTAMRKEW